MLTIRDAQMRVLSHALFESWLSEEMQRRFPELLRTLGGAGVRAFTGESLTRASALGLDTDDAVRFTAMELVFGPEFYSTGDWARRVFLEPVAGTLRDRFQRLVEAAVFRLAEISEAETTNTSAEAPSTSESGEQEVAEPEYTEPPEPDEISFPGADEAEAEALEADEVEP